MLNSENLKVASANLHITMSILSGTAWDKNLQIDYIVNMVVMLFKGSTSSSSPIAIKAYLSFHWHPLISYEQ